MSKPKRVSLKGKGAAIFFGDYTPTPQSKPVENQKSPEQTSLPSQQAISTTQPDHLFSTRHLQEYSSNKPDDTANRRADEVANRRTGEPTKRRIIKRQSMDFYQDQLETLSKHSLREKLEGKQGGMSQMIREALDDYIEKKKLKI
jgi:hypothetical protein